jgi:ribosomal protein L40E
MERIALIIFVLICSACGSDEPTDAEQCQNVRDRLIDLRLADATHVDVDAHRKAMRRALGDDFIASCTTKLSVTQRRCVLDARDAASATACAREP